MAQERRFENNPFNDPPLCQSCGEDLVTWQFQQSQIDTLIREYGSKSEVVNTTEQDDGTFVLAVANPVSPESARLEEELKSDDRVTTVTNIDPGFVVEPDRIISECGRCGWENMLSLAQYIDTDDFVGHSLKHKTKLERYEALKALADDDMLVAAGIEDPVDNMDPVDDDEESSIPSRNLFGIDRGEIDKDEMVEKLEGEFGEDDESEDDGLGGYTCTNCLNVFQSRSALELHKADCATEKKESTSNIGSLTVDPPEYDDIFGEDENEFSLKGSSRLEQTLDLDIEKIRKLEEKVKSSNYEMNNLSIEEHSDGTMIVRNSEGDEVMRK